MKVEDCKGCIIYSTDYKCYFIYKDMVCPCTTCLVKVMCNKNCKEFNKHKEDLTIKKSKEIWNKK